MRNIIKIHKRDIIVGAVGSLVATFAIWIANWFISAAPKVGSSILETILNFIYTLAATQKSSFLILVVGSSLFGYSLGSFFWTLRGGMSVLTKIEGKLNPFPNNAVDETKKQSSLNKFSQSSASQIETIDDIAKKRKRFVFLFIELILLTTVLYLAVVLLVFMPINFQDRFDQDITIIYPYVEEQQVLQLKSDWMLMRSKADYDSIYEYINMIKEENNLLR